MLAVATTTPTQYMHGHRRMEEEIKKRSTAQVAYKMLTLRNLPSSSLVFFLLPLISCFITKPYHSLAS